VFASSNFRKGVTEKVQSQILQCLRSWIVAGEIAVSDLAETPLFACAFDSLDSGGLFDAAVDVVCDIIHETQEIDENMSVIELIVDRLVQLRPKITAAQTDSDAMRGYARVYSEAGETYRLLILQHPETFFPIVEAIGECSACSDLDVVPITFQFWMRLAQSIGKRPSVSPLFIEAYKTLMAVMIRHLHFPEDLSSWTAQEADDFRSFRHVMGDTLKDCCIVLGMEHCLSTVFELLTAALAKRSAPGSKQAPWQEIEAPLFSLRSMGAEIDPTDDRIIPKIMDLMPSLPDHPRVRYAAILVISRYSEWTNRHPSYIPFQLQFISSGFESSDSEVAAAASQAMNYLCLDCKRVRVHERVWAKFLLTYLQHMVSYLPQLHSFLTSMGGNMLQEDRRKIYEAVGHVITAMPMEQAAQSLKTFSVEILAKIHAVVSRSTTPTKQEIQEVSGKCVH
jgi:transportin-3